MSSYKMLMDKKRSGRHQEAWDLRLAISRRVLKEIWTSYCTPGIRRRFNQKNFLWSSCGLAVCSTNCFLTCIENCSLDFLSIWGDRNTVYKARDSGSPIFFVNGISPEIWLLWLAKDFITTRIFAAMTLQQSNFCHSLQTPWHLEMAKISIVM